MKFTAPKPSNILDETSSRRPLWIAAGVGLALLLVLLLAMVSTDGCRNDSAALHDLNLRGEKGLRGSDEHLVRAISLLEHIEDYQQNQAIAQIMAQLGQWIADQPPLDEWTADALVSSLPRRYAPMAQQQGLAQMEFIIQDYYALSEAVWMSNVARWQVAEKNNRRAALQQQIDDVSDELRQLEDDPTSSNQRSLLQAKLDKLNEQLDPAWLIALRTKGGQRAADDLTTAMQLFDWTVRNVQLETTNWEATLPEEGKDPPSKIVPPPPGAALHAWQALMLGRGDAASRGRIFLLLARQQNIEVIMLGLNSQATAGEPRPWAAGVVLGDDIYLFDPELGLPIPGPNGEGIATLQQLRQQPQLLRQLDLPDAPYSVAAEDLDGLVALIDASPQALSQRMLLVEKKLPSEHKLALTVDPGPLQRRLRKMGLSESRIWVAPYRAFVYDFYRQHDTEANNKLEDELAVYGGPLPLFPARMYHFRGQLDSQPGEPGAKGFYLACRKPDREIEQISSSPELREQVLERNPELKDHPEVLAAMLRQIQRGAVEAKRQSTYWLGLVAFEDGELGAAVDFLKERTLKADPDGPWTNSARYNLARVYEASNQHDLAIALYEADTSPQRHGNLLRARRLRGEPAEVAP